MQSLFEQFREPHSGQQEAFAMSQSRWMLWVQSAQNLRLVTTRLHTGKEIAISTFFGVKKAPVLIGLND